MILEPAPPGALHGTVLTGTPLSAAARSLPLRPFLRAVGIGAALSCALAAALPAPAVAQAPATQNPSPMVEETRAHERLAPRPLDGVTRAFPGPAGRAVDLYLPRAALAADRVDLVVHFHGAAWLPHRAVDDLGAATVAAVVNLGAGSSAYDRAFADLAAFDSLLAGVRRELSAVTGRPTTLGALTLTAFSAGHGAVRAILREPRHFAAVSTLLLLDGMHTAYVPERTPLADGGALDTTNLLAFADFARAAVRGEKRFVVTHSEIFPGTFASTTETAGWILRALGLRRAAVLRWGPRGMQQLGEARAGDFEVLAFAGNSAPDHVDHFHALPELLARALDGRCRGGPAPPRGRGRARPDPADAAAEPTAAGRGRHDCCAGIAATGRIHPREADMHHRFEFEGSEVRALLEESYAAEERVMTEAQRYLAAGVDLHAEAPDVDDEIDHPGTGAPPGLWLMNDRGVYLRSNAARRRDADVAYARGYRAEVQVGDEPFCEFIEARSLEQLRPDDTLVVTVSEEKLRLSLMRRA
jgi:hypothetical protein